SVTACAGLVMLSAACDAVEGRAPARPPETRMETTVSAKQELGPPVTRLRIGNPVHPYVLSPIAVTPNAPRRLITEVGEGNVTLRMRLTSGEALWGLGERFDALNMRGRT